MFENKIIFQFPANTEKQVLTEARVVIKRIQFESKNIENLKIFSSTKCSEEQGFPKLHDCGVFERLQCLRNSRDLVVIDLSVAARF